MTNDGVFPSDVWFKSSDERLKVNEVQIGSSCIYFVTHSVANCLLWDKKGPGSFPQESPLDHRIESKNLISLSIFLWLIGVS